ncbi:MAG: prepilin-type N-terminal cleavage/methylation domain-containing protein, partial [Synergistaceae bacterium]|nr:prepilin-type N-terminal cleavage/methylation domain-containing protein [Synergistaceae bacterium]
MGNRRNGFTLVELLTAIVVMTIISGAAMMSLTAADQTA